MKNVFKIIIGISICLFACFALGSCSGEHTHKPADAVIENEVKSTCKTNGSYDEVVYCSVCDEEMSRTEKTIKKLDHNPSAPVKENDVAVSCVFDGGYDMATYCSVCEALIEREHTTVKRLDHQYNDSSCTVCCGLISSEGLKFELNSDQKSYTLVGIGMCNSSDIVIGLHNDLPVTAIGYRAFFKCESIESVTFGTNNWVETIDISAFNGCTKLKELNLPDSVTSIGLDCFRDCTSLTKVTIGSSLKSIGVSAFQKCTKLSDVYLSDSVSVIGGSAFAHCYAIRSIDLPNSITSIGTEAFYRCYGLKNIVLPDGIKDIQDKAFGDCTRLETVILGDSLKSIASTAFYNCRSLKYVIIPDGVERMRSYTFYDCKNLDYVVIGKSVNTIESSTFFRCSAPKLYYNGTEAAWSQISIGSENEDYEKLYFYSETEPTDKTKGYWRYVDGVPTVW